jgi:hypothetical protein
MRNCKRCKKLESIIIDIHWMARRYADGRQTYAVEMFNDAVRLALGLGMEIKRDPIADSCFAQDGDPRISKGVYPDRNCRTLEDGTCIGINCMHDTGGPL